jgi:hypothetical protein
MLGRRRRPPPCPVGANPDDASRRAGIASAVVDEPHPDLDVGSMVVVPKRAAPLLRLSDVDRGRDETDDLLDDLFGEVDDRGPGPVDAVLVVGGSAAVAAGLAVALPVVVTVGGVAAVGLGAVLPLRSLWRRVGSARRSRRRRSLLGDGALLRTDHPSVVHLLAAHQRLLTVSDALAASPRRRVHDIAHGAVLEVASLLGGRVPGTEAEVDYVAARTRALGELAQVVADPRVGDGEAEKRRALVEARSEIEQLAGGSSLTDASDLARELGGSDAR